MTTTLEEMRGAFAEYLPSLVRGIDEGGDVYSALAAGFDALKAGSLSWARLNQIMHRCSEAGMSEGFFRYYFLDVPLAPSKELRDLRALLRHRHQWVRMRTRVQNALQAIALANGLRRGPSLWSQAGQHTIASLPLAPHSAHRRTELLALYVKFESEIEKLNQRVEEQACKRPGAQLLMTHPGVGPVTALATDIFLGDPTRFADGKALASYVGIIPSEYSSGGRQKLGGLSKQGNPLLRFLWCEAAMHAVRRDPELQRFYRRKLIQKGLGKSRVAAARKLGIRLWIMLRDKIDYNEFCRRGQKQQKSGDACAGMPDTAYGAKQSPAE
jgi:transposase